MILRAAAANDIQYPHVPDDYNINSHEQLQLTSEV